MRNYILEYYQKISDGTEPAGKWIKLLYEYIMKGLEKKTFFYDPKKAERVIKFVETFCRHHEGDLAPNLIRLELWQKAQLSVMFGIVDETGARQFREVFDVKGRKNGKTLMAAAVSCYMTFLDNEYGARIFFCAPKLAQARLCFDAYYQMIAKEPELSALAKKRRTDVYVELSNTSAMPLAFNAKKSDGLNPSFTVCDEIAGWPPGDAGMKQYEVLKSALGARRQPMLYSISTAGYSEGIYDELMKRSTAVLLGTSKETRLAPFIYQIDDINKWNDLNELRKSMPNLGVSVPYDYMLEEIAIAENSLSKKNEFLTKYCNVRQNSSVAWIDAQTIEKTTGEQLHLEDFRECYATMGIDLSKTTDMSSAVLVIERDGMLNVFSRLYLPANKIEEASARDGLPYKTYIERGLLYASGENFIDYRDIYNWAVELVEKYHIYPLKIGYDRYSATYLVQSLSEYGFHTDDVYQGENLSPVIREAEGLLKDGKINIGDNDLMKIHLLNTAVKVNIETERLKLIKIDARSHIDSAAALIDALTVRQKWWSEIGAQLVNERR